MIRVATVMMVALLAATGAEAQIVEPAAQDTLACDGQRINSINITTMPPAVVGRASGGIRRAVMSVLFQASTTEQSVAESFLLLRVGENCNPRRLAEAIRVLRVQPFISRATIVILPDADGGVRLEVETIDEIPVIAGGRISGGLSALKLGNSNLGGNGLMAAIGWRDGDFYRDGFSVELRKHGLFGQPVVVGMEATRNPLGHDISVTAQRPFFSNMQRFGWYAGAREFKAFESFVRPDDVPLFLESKRLEWSAGAVARIGGRSVGLFAGPVVMYERFRPAGNAVIVSDSGIEAPDSDELLGRYNDITTFRAGAVAGLRLLSYARVAGFDALLGEQDIARGVQIAVLGARGVEAIGAEDKDDFAAADIYLGFGGGRTFAAVRGNAEGQRPREGGSWNSQVLSARAAAYFKRSDTRTWELSAEYAGAWRQALPTQLSLGKKGGGPRGYQGSDLPGDRRVVIRAEERRAMGALSSVSHWGLAGFVDAARIWGGNAPFGADLNLRASVGISLLAAVPPQSRRLLRLDIAVPVTEGAKESWRVTLSARDVTRVFWREPRDIARSRSVSLPASLFGWP
jgi:hypothetical protein